MSRDVLTIADLTPNELTQIVALAAQCKRNPRLGAGALANRVLALIFQKPSVRTRVSFEVAIRHLGGAPIYLGAEDIELDKREPINDVARTLSRYVDGIVARMFSHRDMEALAEFASVPVINGLSDTHHPCQALADVLTLQERFGRIKGLRICYIGDGNNVLHSLAQAISALGADLVVATPEGYRPDPAIWAEVTADAQAHGTHVTWTGDPYEAARHADALYTDVWTSMGFERERKARLKAFQGFQVTTELIKRANRGCVVMHCLPAHRGEEITEEALEGPASIVFDQAENRLHAQKALLLTLYGDASRSHRVSARTAARKRA